MSVVFTDMNFKKRVRERTLSFRRIILTTHWKYDFDAYSKFQVNVNPNCCGAPKLAKAIVPPRCD